VSVRDRPTPPQLLPQPPLSPTRSRPRQPSLHLATIRATHACRPTQSSSSGFTRYLRHGDSPLDARSLTQHGRSWRPHTSSQVYRMHSSSPPSFEPPTRPRSGFLIMRVTCIATYSDPAHSLHENVNRESRPRASRYRSSRPRTSELLDQRVSASPPSVTSTHRALHACMYDPDTQISVPRVSWIMPVPFIPARPRHLALLYPKIVKGHSVLATRFCLQLSFPSFSSSFFPSSFPLPSGDRLASIVFLFETGLLPNIDDAAPRLPLSRLSCYRLGPLLFLLLRGRFSFFCVA
jgi:hypothetical protein